MPGTFVNTLQTLNAGSTILTTPVIRNLSGTITASPTETLISALYGSADGIILTNNSTIALHGSLTQNLVMGNTLAVQSYLMGALGLGGTDDTLVNNGVIFANATDEIRYSGVGNLTFQAYNYGAAVGTGVVLNNAAGLISGTGRGLYLEGSETIINHGTIAGALKPIWTSTIAIDGTFFVNTYGGSYGYGIASGIAAGFANILNDGTISGETGIYIHQNSAFISNSTAGVIIGKSAPVQTYQGAFATGIQQYAQINFSNGTTTSYYHGFVSVLNAGTIAAILSNPAAVSSSFSNEIAGINLGQGIISNASTGLISGYNVGVIQYYPSSLGVDFYNQGRIIQTGSAASQNFTGSQAAAIDIVDGSINNSGIIEANASLGIGIELTAGTVVNSGVVQGGSNGQGIAFSGAGTVQNSGTILGGIEFGTGASTLWLLSGSSQITDTVAAQGSIALEIAGSGEIDLGGSFADISSITFPGPPGPGALLLDLGLTLAGTSAELAGGQSITGFGANETLVVEGFSDINATYVSGIGLELGADTLDIAGSFATADFAVTTDGANTTITTAVPCFCAGTRIATSRGAVAVEHLRVGDMLPTLHGGAQRVRWIGTRAYAGRFLTGQHLMLPVTVKADAIADGIPARDLCVSPGHALLVDGHLMPAWRLINNVSITQAQSVAQVEYFHIELDAHNILFAESCPAESFYDEDCRAQFHNAASAPASPLGAPLPRCESGFALEAARTRLAARAGLTAPAPQTGALRGFVDIAGPTLAAGWAQNVNAPESPVALDVRLNGVRIARILANEYRADLRAAGLGSGCHGFSFTLPNPGLVEIRRAADGAVLALTEAAQAA